MISSTGIFLNFSLFAIEFSLLTSLINFSAIIDPNKLIVDSVDFSWSLLSKNIKIPNF